MGDAPEAGPNQEAAFAADEVEIEGIHDPPPVPPAVANANPDNVVAVPENPETSVFLDLPEQTRAQILTYLSPTEHKTLRLACKKFKKELEQNVGMNAILSGGQPWNEMTSAEKRRVIFGLTDHHKKLQQNTVWIESVLVRSLRVRQLSRMTDFGYLAPKLKNQNHLKTLKIEMDKDKVPSLSIISMIRTYTAVTSLAVTGITSDLTYDEGQNFNKFSMDVLKCIATHDQLKQLKFRIEPQFNPDQLDRSHYARKIVGNLSNTPQSDFDNPWPLWANRVFLKKPEPIPNWSVKLNKIDVYVLTLTMVHLRAWKSFLDFQNELTRIKLNLGLVDWKFYRTLLFNNSEHLQHLDLVTINWHKDKIPVNEVIPQEETLDWNVLNPTAATLKSLRISMIQTHAPFLPNIKESERGEAHNTINLQNLQLNNLTKLELICIHFQTLQLNHIFSGFPNLSEVAILFWTRTGEAPERNGIGPNDVPPEDYGQRNTNLFDLLNTVLPQRRFTRIMLTDPSLDNAMSDIRVEIFQRARIIPGTTFHGHVQPRILEINVEIYN